MLPGRGGSRRDLGMRRGGGDAGFRGELMGDFVNQTGMRLDTVFS